MPDDPTHKLLLLYPLSTISKISSTISFGCHGHTEGTIYKGFAGKSQISVFLYLLWATLS